MDNDGKERKELTRDAKGNLMDVNEIMRHLPHRYPFILVDKIVEFDFDKRTVVGHKNVTINEPFFQGHFPEVPIMPGVLILEALAQVGGILIYLLGLQQENKIALLLSVNDAKFRTPVIPGDVLSLRCEGIHCTTKGGKVKAEAYVGDKLAAQAEIGFVLVDKTQI